MDMLKKLDTGLVKCWGSVFTQWPFEVLQQKKTKTQIEKKSGGEPGELFNVTIYIFTGLQLKHLSYILSYLVWNNLKDMRCETCSQTGCSRHKQRGEEKKRAIKSVSSDLPDKNQKVLSPPALDKGV